MKANTTRFIIPTEALVGIAVATFHQSDALLEVASGLNKLVELHGLPYESATKLIESLFKINAAINDITTIAQTIIEENLRDPSKD